MNRIYKVIWSKTKHCYVVVSELAKRHTKGGSAGGCRMMTARVLSTLLLGAYMVGGYSLPAAWADGEPNQAEIEVGDTIAGGSNVTVAKVGTTITISATDTTYTAGNGLQLEGTAFSVKADGNTITVGENGIKVNADGAIASGNTGIVTGGAVYNVTQPLTAKTAGITREGTKTTIEQGFNVQTNSNSGSSDGYMNVYWGQGTLANGENATAWGKSTVARSPRSTAWGNEATAKGDQATAFGSRTTAYGVNSTAWGADTVAFSYQATAFGENTTAGGQRATAWGHKTTAGGDSSTAYGKETSALMEGATAWGNNTKAGRWTYTDANGVVHDALVIQPYTEENNGSEMYEIVDAVTREQIHNGENDYIAAYDWLAANGTVNGVYSTAWGNGTQAAGDYSTAFGNYTKTAAVTSLKYNGTEAKVVSEEVVVTDASGKIVYQKHPETGELTDEPLTETKYKIANAVNSNTNLIGDNTYFDTEDAAMKYLLQNATITGGYGATAFGLYSEANGAHSTAFGVGTTARGTGATAFGFKTIASGANSTAFGEGTTASNMNATAFGSRTIASSDNSTAFGVGTTAKGVSSTAFGSDTTASERNATAFGEGTLADGPNSTAWGVYTQALSHQSTAFGHKTTAGHDYATAWGYETTAGDRTTTAFGDNTAALMEGATAWGHNTKAGKWTVKDNTGKVHDLIIETYIDNNPAGGKRELWGVKYAENKGTDNVFIGGQTSYTSAYTELEGRASTDPNVTMQGNYATAWGNGTEAEGDYSTAFGNFTKTAAVTSFKYNGTEAKVVSEVVEVKDANGDPVTITDPANPESGETIPATELKYTIVNADNPEIKLSGTYFDSEDAAMNEIVKNGTITGGYGATAFGLLTEAKGAHSTAFGVGTVAEGIGATAWGNGAQATGDYSTAWGKDAQATGNYATAIGAAIDDNSTVTASEAQADYSVAMLGGKTYKSPDDPHNNPPINAKNSLAIGVGSLTYAENSIAVLGGMTDEKATNSIAIGRGKDTPSLANAENSLAVLGGAAGNHGTNSIALGGALGKDTDNNDIFVSSTTYGPNSVAMLGGTTGYPDSGNELLQAKNALAIGLDSVAGGSNSIAIGHGGKDSADHIVGSNAYAENSLAVFGGTTISGATNSIALGGAVDASGVFVSSTTKGTYSVAVLGGETAEEATNALAIGRGAQATLSDSVALGSGAVADRAKYDGTNNSANEDNSKTGSAWRATANAIAIGHIDTDDTKSVTRQIIGVAAGTEDTDAVNVAQLKAATFDMQGIQRTRSGNDNDGYTYTTTIEDKLSVSSNGVFSISGDKFTVDSDGAISAAGGISAAKGAGGYNFTVDSSDGSIRTNGNISAVGDISADNITVAEGTYSYISAGTDVAGSLVSLDSQVKTNTDAIATKANTTDITVAADGNFISAGTDVAGNLVSLDNAVKANAGTIQGITRSGDATDGYTTTIEGKLSVSSNGAFSISGDKFTVDSDGAISAAGGKFAVGAEGTLSAGATTVSGLTVGTKDRTTELTTEGVVADGDAGAGYVTGSTVATALAGKADVATTLAGYGITDAAKIDASNLTAENVTFWSVKLGTGAVASGNDGLVTGGTVYAVTSALDTRITANTTALENKAGVDLANISDAGKTAIKNLITVKQGANVKVTKTEENGVDTYAIEAIAATGSGAYNSGKGIIISETSINVNKGGGLTFEGNDNKLTINIGDDLTIDETGKLQVQKNGKIEENNKGIVTGGMVFTATSALDTRVTTAEGKMTTAEGNIAALQTKTEKITVSEGTTTISGNLSSGATTVSALTVGSTNVTEALTTTGAIVNNNAGFVTGGTVYAATSVLDSRITTAEGKMTTAEGNITALQTKAQNVTASEGATTISGTLSSGATTVSALTVGSTNVTEALTTTGAVVNNNAGFVTGGTVYAVTSALETGKAGVDLANITGAGKQVVRDLIEVKAGTNVEVSKSTSESGVDTYTISATAASGGSYTSGNGISISGSEISVNNGGGLTFDSDKKLTINTGDDLTVDGTGKLQVNKSGKVEESNTGLVTGGTVFNALSGYAKIDGATLTNATLTGATFKSGSIANDVTIGSSGVTIGTLKSSVDTNTSDISALKATLNDANTGLIKTVNDNANAIQKNATDITSLNSKITANETALSNKADKANTLKGYGIEDAYTKEDTDTLLNKKADNTELEKVKATAESNKAALNALGDVQDLAKDAEAVKKIANDVETVVKEQDGAVAAEGQKDADELVKGSTVYDYLNKGKDGNGKLVLGTESKNITMGQGSEATGDESIAIGNETGGQKNVAKGKQSIAIGFGNKVTGDHSGAFGDPSTVTGTNSYAFGNNNTVGGNNTFVMGNNVNTSATNAVVLGDGSVGVDNAVSVGAPGNERQIKNVAPGTEATDVATMGQVYTVAQNINKVDNRLNKVGAGAAALAALHPIDTDDKFTMGMGYGNYRSAHAMAMGMFYRPTEKIMISVGGAFGNGENMVNAGISFALDKGKGFGTSKAVMAKNIKALSAENAAIKEENAGMKKQLDAQGQEIAALKEALARLEAKIGK